ncbi:XK-related protein 8-like [Triplophysa rosa]|uniref:XK-related protein n=1 Tax=Triplophysa rosa TaxID=992332 RepID=A0A9W7TKU2_TRIRA|nr:XK-related protein 8-like [Triplophysa rosa]KAI7798719.1 putative XK-related protein 8-like [Triplophysa rosa]
MEETFPFHFTLKDYIFSLFGLLSSLLDIGLDVWTVVSFYQDGAHVYMGVMIFLLLFSSVLVQVFSWRWYSDSLDKLQTHVEKYVNKHNLLKAFHAMQLGVYLRYAGLVEISTRRFRQPDCFQEGVAVNLNHDLYMLRLIEAFSENAPQLTLMMSIIAMRQELQLFTALKTLAAVAAIALSVVTYHRSMREFLPDKRKMTWTRSVVYYLWNLLVIAPRVTALALFTSVFPCYIIAHFLSVWMVLVLVVWSQKTDFMEDPRWEWLFRATVGLIWYFSWFNVGSKNTKLKSIIYYTVLGLDTMALLGFWWWKMEHACILLLRPYIMIITLASLYVLGIILRIIYYKVFHPNCDIEKIDELNEPVMTTRAAACINLVETDSAKEVSPETPTPTQPVTGAQKRMRTMAANFYL